MPRGAYAVLAFFALVAAAPPTFGAAADYATLRRAADAFEARQSPGANLWRADLTAWYRDGWLQILTGQFHYFVVAGRPVMLVRADTKNLPGMYLPQVERGDPSELRKIPVKNWVLYL